MVRFVLFFAVVVGSTLLAVADIPPPPPGPGMKRVPYEHVLKLGAEIPGYKFYTYRGGVGGGDSIEELKLTKDRGVIVPASSSASVRTGVMAVPVKVVDELKTNEKLAEVTSWRNKDNIPTGVVLYATYGTSQDLKSNDPRTKVESVITITPDDKAGVKFIAEVTPAANKGAANETQPRSAMLIAGVSGSLAIVTLGLWWMRRQNLK